MTYPGALDLAAIKARLAQIEYKPGWKIEAYEGAYEGAHLVISATVQNSYDPSGDTVALDVRVALPPFFTVEEFDRYLLWRVKMVEVHEAMEWLRVDGKPIFDPHRENANRDAPLGL